MVVPPPSPDPSATQNPSPSSPPDPASVLDSGGLRKYGDGKFITGISFVASPAPKFLMLFVSIPYLGLGSPTSGSGSRTLRQYRHQSPMEGKVVVVGSPVPEIVVHQTWFLVFNDGLPSPAPPPATGQMLIDRNRRNDRNIQIRRRSKQRPCSTIPISTARRRVSCIGANDLQYPHLIRN